jgi:hypothetical protein
MGLVVVWVANLLVALGLWFLEPPEPVRIADSSDLGAVIDAVFRDEGLGKETIRVRTDEFGNGASRTTYTAHVPPEWPKTRFHLHLADTLRQLGVRTYGVVEFPERHLRIHILHNGKVVRTVALVTDPKML